VGRSPQVEVVHRFDGCCMAQVVKGTQTKASKVWMVAVMNAEG